MDSRIFSFTEKKDGVRVAPEDIYDDRKGYGFLQFGTQTAPADRFTGSGGWNPGEEWAKKQEEWSPVLWYGTSSAAKSTPRSPLTKEERFQMLFLLR